MAMEALKHVHEAYVRAQRMHAANLMAHGATVTDVDESLGSIDALETELWTLREALWQEYEAEKAGL